MRELDIHDLNACVRRTPRKLRSMMQKHGSKVVVAGGFIRSVVTNERISDVDTFAGNKETSEIFATELQGDGKFHKTDNAFTVTNVKPKVQFIFRWAYEENSPKLILLSFDFTICQAAFWFDLNLKKWRSVCGNDFYSDLAAKRLVYLSPDRNEDAGGSMLRVLKYYQRGFRIPLDSLGAVIARMMTGVDEEKIKETSGFKIGSHAEKWLGMVLSGLLYEVDPNAVIDHRAYLPAIPKEEEKGDEV